jgi:hypothetical protein
MKNPEASLWILIFCDFHLRLGRLCALKHPKMHSHLNISPPPSRQYQLTQTKSHILIIWRRTWQEDKVVTFFSTSFCCPSFILFFSTSCNYVWTVKFQYLISCDKIKTNVHRYNSIQQTCLLTTKLHVQCSPLFFTLFSGGCGRTKKKNWSAPQKTRVPVLIGVFFAGEEVLVGEGGQYLYWKLQRVKPDALSGAAQLKDTSPPTPPSQQD